MVMRVMEVMLDLNHKDTEVDDVDTESEMDLKISANLVSPAF